MGGALKPMGKRGLGYVHLYEPRYLPMPGMGGERTFVANAKARL
jgi:hypothetical protein